MIVSATMGVAVLYMISFVISLSASASFTPTVCSAADLFVVGIAAMNLVLDFDFIEDGRARCTSLHGVVRSVCLDGYFDLALP